MKRLLPLFLLLLGLTTACDTTKKTSRRAESVHLTEDRAYRANALFLEAERQKNKRNFDAMHELLTAALDINPDMPEALYELATLKMTLLGSKTDSAQAEECIRIMKRSIALDPDNVYYKKVLAGFYILQGMHDEAISIYENLAQRNPDPEQLQYLVSLYEDTGNFDKALATLERLEEIDGISEEHTLSKCRIYNQMGETDKMLSTMENLCAEYPDDLRYRVMLGDFCAMCYLDTAALDIYNEVLTAEPENPYAQLSMQAYCQLQNGMLTVEEYNEWQAANGLHSSLNGDETYWTMKIMFNPATPSSERERAIRLYIEKEQPDTATVSQLFQRVLSIPQNDARIARLYLSYIYTYQLPTSAYEFPLRLIYDMGTETLQERFMMLPILVQRWDNKEIAEFCREARMNFPDETDFYYYEALADHGMGKSDDCIAVLKAGDKTIDKETDAELAGDFYSFMGDILHDRGEKQEAYAAYDRALTYRNDIYLCMNNYAYFLALDGERLDYAETLSRKAVEANSEDPVYLDTHAWVLYRKELFTQARIYIDRALRNIEKVDDKAGYYDHAGDIFYMCGEKKQAIEHWKTALRLSADEELNTKLREKIKQKRVLP